MDKMKLSQADQSLHLNVEISSKYIDEFNVAFLENNPEKSESFYYLLCGKTYNFNKSFPLSLTHGIASLL